MKCHFLINGSTTLILSPENPLEEEIIKSLAAQKNEIIQISATVTIINKTMRNGLLIGKQSFLPGTKSEDSSDGKSEDDAV